ncbi:hypothetical protein J0871_16810 [Salegentibacter sp. BDJ18]|uniref:hypothetical protein n=1 Tax=Salegentibacter sp. BDJ18 TaxID=2816376 RepID=UPI001AAFADF8|nr:hypothetical protein [Salegentibacter sp. BDJ18]MBO2546079.1 hypothetical protein [Salegentibacter sp. BDJ18]
MEIPEKYTELVGTKQQLGGGLFSGKKEMPFEEYDILDLRWGSAKIVDMETLKPKCPTIEYLIKKDGMRASRWTRGFPVPEIELKEWD